MRDRDQHCLAAALDWSMAMGADCALTDAAIDWLVPGRAPPGAGFELGDQPDERAAAPPPTATAPAARPPLSSPPAARPAAPASAQRRFATSPPDVAASSARAAARKALTLDELGAALQAFDGCSLKATAKNLCFYRGAPSAPVMIIGEAPGRDEDLEGRPFVGRAGQLLDRMLTAIGLSEADVHITNIVYWRPPGNRTPTPQEAEICRPFLERQIELVAPRVLLLLGGAAAKQILRTEEGILRLRGTWRQTDYGSLKLATMASLHPAYLLRTPAAKRQVWRDLLEVRRALREAGAWPERTV